MSSITVTTTPTNVLSGATIAEIIALIDAAANATNAAGSNVTLQQKAVQQLLLLYTDLQSNRALGLANLTNKTPVTNAINAIDPVAKASYAAGTGSATVGPLSAFLTNKQAITDSLTALRTLMTGTDVTTNKRVNTQDMVFYQYSRAGESGLNVQLGQLGDAINSLNQAVTQLNRVEAFLAISPGQKWVNERGELLSYYSTNTGATAASAPSTYTTGDTSIFYNAITQFKNTEVNPAGGYLDAFGVLKDTLSQLTGVLGQFTAGSDQYQALNKVIVTLRDTYGINGWNAPANNTSPGVLYDRDAPSDNAGDAYYKTNYDPPENFPKNLVRLFNDTAFRKTVADALSTAQSQNDVQQQNLRKAQFLYEQFVKSAGDVMDRLHQATQNILQKISS